MDPTPQVVLLTTQKINKYLSQQNQNESYISEAWVFQTLKTHIAMSIETGLILTESEISDRVATIAIRRIRANIVVAERFKNDKQLLVRPFDERAQDFSQNTVTQIPDRGEMALRRQRYEGELPNRFIDLSDKKANGSKP